MEKRLYVVPRSVKISVELYAPIAVSIDPDNNADAKKYFFEDDTDMSSDPWVNAACNKTETNPYDL